MNTAAKKSALPIVLVILYFLSMLPVHADEDPLFSATRPIFLGEQRFRERIARDETGGKPLGILLSGGSARAYAHIGVLKRLEEADVVPDFIVANSMGAIVALLYASGMDPDEMEAVIASVPAQSLFRHKLPFGGGILDPDPFMNILHRLFGDVRIEDLPIPVLIVCDDLVSKRQVWLAEGDLLTIMRAAFSMPVYFDPVPFDGMILVDGGISNLVPVSVMSAFTDRMIVAATFYRNGSLNFTNPLTILNRNFTISKERTAIAEILEADPPFIRCAVEDISFMDYSKIGEIVDRGYRSADDVLPSILEKTGTNPKDIGAIRGTTGERLGPVAEMIELGRPLRHHRPRALASLKIEFPESFNSPYHFIGDPYGMVLARAEAEAFGVSGGIYSPLTALDPGAVLGLDAGSFGPVNLTSLALVSDGSVYSYARIQAPFYAPEPVRWTPFADAEFLSDTEFDPVEEYHRAGLVTDLTGDHQVRPRLSLYAFHRKSEAVPDGEQEEPEASGDVRGIGGEISCAFAAFSPIELRARALGRYGLAGSGDFPVFDADGYRGLVPDGTDVPHAVFNAEIAFNRNRMAMAFGETILLQRIDLAAYADALVDGENSACAVGGSLTVTVSLIGLIPFTATLYSGYDFASEEPFLAVRFGSMF